MKRKWAGSQMKPSEWHASTQDWPSWDMSSLRELRGGQAAGAVRLDAQPRAVELARGTNMEPVILLPPADSCLEKLAGTKGGSSAQKSWRGKILWPLFVKSCYCARLSEGHRRQERDFYSADKQLSRKHIEGRVGVCSSHSLLVWCDVMGNKSIVIILWKAAFHTSYRAQPLNSCFCHGLARKQ